MSDIKWKQEEFELLWKDKDYWKQEDGSYICPLCNQGFSKYGIKNHIKILHYGYPAPKYDKVAWNKGLTKKTDIRVKKSGETYSRNFKLGLIKSNEGCHLSEEMRKKGINWYEKGSCRW
jgi:hypothetical protein